MSEPAAARAPTGRVASKDIRGPHEPPAATAMRTPGTRCPNPCGMQTTPGITASLTSARTGRPFSTRTSMPQAASIPSRVITSRRQ
ncbi:MAG: hypothetical protein U1E86_04455 [Burkholderiaceae bacterium]